tara:strand:+ start:898 stop:1713 length:816 start_codon:yes stop_codon:yes gene_type:complete
MIPNRFPDHGEIPDYNSVDASLWFVHAVDRYLAYTGDEKGAGSDIWNIIREIIEASSEGTRYGIQADDDGLLTAGEPGVQLTWMDAKVGDWVVTPRSVKPVEVNALWVHALSLASTLAEVFDDRAFAETCAGRKKKAAASFETTFWNPETACLYDLVDGDHRDESIRPNQILALSLPGRPLSRGQELSVLQVVEEKLLTPVGLRSLAPEDPSYQGHYGGDPHARDGAYHQGTVWTWLLGPFVTAWVRAARRAIKGGKPCAVLPQRDKTPQA